MTINEFRAWLDGFAEGFDGAPSAEQWARVLVKADELAPYSCESITRPLTIDPEAWRPVPRRLDMAFGTFGPNDPRIRIDN